MLDKTKVPEQAPTSPSARISVKIQEKSKIFTSPANSIRKHKANVSKPIKVDKTILLKASPKKKKLTLGAKNPIISFKELDDVLKNRV